MGKAFIAATVAIEVFTRAARALSNTIRKAKDTFKAKKTLKKKKKEVNKRDGKTGKFFDPTQKKKKVNF